MSMKRKQKTHKSATQTIKNKHLKSVQCSPASNTTNDFTCYADETLETMKTLWNTKHPDDIIKAADPLNIWENLREKFANVCDTEKCWIRQHFAKGKLGSDVLQYTFAPSAPKSWSANPKEWLSSIEISNVMKHFEKFYTQFSFMGPSPIDFDTSNVDGKCVWN